MQAAPCTRPPPPTRLSSSSSSSRSVLSSCFFPTYFSSATTAFFSCTSLKPGSLADAMGLRALQAPGAWEEREQVALPIG